MARTTDRGLVDGAEVRVRGTEFRSAFKGTIKGAVRTALPSGHRLVDVRQHKNGGIYLVPIQDVSIIRRKHYKAQEEQ